MKLKRRVRAAQCDCKQNASLNGNIRTGAPLKREVYGRQGKNRVTFVNPSPDDS